MNFDEGLDRWKNLFVVSKEACNVMVTIALRNMGRNWIKIETVTMDKPEVCVIATQLKMDPDAVVGKLVRLWSWAEVNRINSNEMRVTFEFLDKLVGKRGFAAALMHAGWLNEESGILRFPNFGRHNGPAGKGRALTAQRVGRHRDRKRNVNENETNDLESGESDSSSVVDSMPPKAKAVNQRKNTVKALLNSDLKVKISSFSEAEGEDDLAVEVAEFKSEMVELNEVPDVVFEEISPNESGKGGPLEDFDGDVETGFDDCGHEDDTKTDESGFEQADNESPFGVSDDIEAEPVGDFDNAISIEVAGGEAKPEEVPEVKKARTGRVRKSGNPDITQQPMLF